MGHSSHRGRPPSLPCPLPPLRTASVWDGKPVEAVSQHVLDVVVLLGADDYHVQHGLQPVELIACNSGQQTVTVVNSEDDETVDLSS